LPFDSAGFPERGGEPRGPVPPGDNLVTFIIVVVTFCLLATPISLGALVDIVRAIRGH
jgi:hypothetical protein